MIIEREKERDFINKTNKWVLLYGRRKTGKSYLVENFIRYDDFFFIKRDKTIISKKEQQTVSYETFIVLIRNYIEQEKTVVIDEFHRLGDGFFDFLHASKKQGKIILISSTLYLSKKLISSKSPLLGLFAEIPLPIIDLRTVLKNLYKFKLNKRNLMELGILLREPIAIEYFDKEMTPQEAFKKVLAGSSKSIPAMIGEIFAEEERSISPIYEGVLRAIANGKVTSSEISSYLFSKKLTEKDDPSIIQQYLSNLSEFGIIKRLQVYNKNRYTYKHVSPLSRLFYYADEKYNIFEFELNELQVEKIIETLLPRLVEDNVRELISKKFGLIETVIEAADYDIDAYLLDYKRPKIAMEVKWVRKITTQDVEKAQKNLDKVDAERKILFVPDKRDVKIKTKLEVWDVEDLL